MYWIEPITDPEILKLGIRMALYREPKPEQPIIGLGYSTEQLEKMSEESIQDNCYDAHEKYIKWQEQSRIAYLKEPEWDIGDYGYYIFEGVTKKFRVVAIKNSLLFFTSTIKGILPIHAVFHFPSILEKNTSHYYPGQEYDGDIKYVRQTNLCIDLEELPSGYVKKVFKWQEVEEPLSDPKKVYRSRVENDMKEVAQFQADKKSAKILAEI